MRWDIIGILCLKTDAPVKQKAFTGNKNPVGKLNPFFFFPAALHPPGILPFSPLPEILRIHRFWIHKTRLDGGIPKLGIKIASLHGMFSFNFPEFLDNAAGATPALRRCSFSGTVSL